jgi:antirestriction protein ArdC
MSRHGARARFGSDRTSLYDDITNQIIAQLEAGTFPWVQPWGTAAAKAPLALPKNASTGRRYSGINILVLWGAVIEHGFPSQGWLTFRQALGLGGHVRKGERGTTVFYADRFVPEGERQRAHETGEEAQAIPFLKRFTVFSGAQCEGLPDDTPLSSRLRRSTSSTLGSTPSSRIPASISASAAFAPSICRRKITYRSRRPRRFRADEFSPHRAT